MALPLLYIVQGLLGLCNGFLDRFFKTGKGAVDGSLHAFSFRVDGLGNSLFQAFLERVDVFFLGLKLREQLFSDLLFLNLNGNLLLSSLAFRCLFLYLFLCDFLFLSDFFSFLEFRLLFLNFLDLLLSLFNRLNNWLLDRGSLLVSFLRLLFLFYHRLFRDNGLFLLFSLGLFSLSALLWLGLLVGFVGVGAVRVFCRGGAFMSLWLVYLHVEVLFVNSFRLGLGLR
jgi:hypothetical protein